MTAETRILTAVACAALLNPLNSSMIAVALPHIAAGCGASFPRLTWLIATYYLVSAITQPVAGKISDLFRAPPRLLRRVAGPVGRLAGHLLRELHPHRRQLRPGPGGLPAGRAAGRTGAR